MLLLHGEIPYGYRCSLLMTTALHHVRVTNRRKTLFMWPLRASGFGGGYFVKTTIQSNGCCVASESEIFIQRLSLIHRLVKIPNICNCRQSTPRTNMPLQTCSIDVHTF